MSDYSFLNDRLSKRTSIFGLRLWVVLGICVGAAIVIVLFLISLWFTSKRQNKATTSSNNNVKSTHNSTIPNVSKEIQEIRVDPSRHSNPDSKLHQTPNPDPLPESEPVLVLHAEEDSSPVSGRNRIHIEIGKDRRIAYPEGGAGSEHGSGEVRSGDQRMAVMEVPHLGWGHWYTLRELEESTNGFAAENVIGEGGYGIVYRGVLEDNTKVAVKNLLNNRMLVYEYVDNGNLEQWLHGDVGPCSPLTWEIRMNIVLGTAKGKALGLGKELCYDSCNGNIWVNLVEWLKTMVTNRNAEGVLDPRLPVKPSSRALKRALLVALRCVDPNAQKRPKMGHVIHMLEADEFPFRDDRRAGRENIRMPQDGARDRLTDKRVNESGDSSGYESGAQTNRSRWRKQESEEQ
ncbi:hypothetical protein POUND7_018586 [Theobroma cacao]